MEIKYKNLGSNKEIKFDLDSNKKIVAIYGKNGTGKTTLSKTSYWEKKYVFNEDFVRENVFESTEEGVKSSPKNKKNLSSLFIGEDVINVKKRIDDFTQRNKDFKSNYLRLKVGIETEIDRKNIGEKIDELVDIYSEKYLPDIDVNLSFDELNSKINDFVIEENKLDEEGFNKNYTMYKNNEKLQFFLSMIKEDKFLEEIIINKQKTRLEEIYLNINNLKELKDKKHEIDRFINDRDIKDSSKLNIAIIDKMLKVQDDSEKCFFCGEDDKYEEIQKWKLYISNKYTSEKNKYIKVLEDINENIKAILLQRGHFDSIPNTLKFLEDLSKDIAKDISSIKKDEINISLNIDELDFEPSIKSLDDLLNELILYLINKNKKQILGSYIMQEKIKNEINKNKRILNDLLDIQSDELTEDINKILGKMHVNRSIDLSIDRSGGEYKYKYLIDKKEINTLSEGERHKLALAFYLTSIKKEGIMNKTIVLDDPVISLDEFGYHVLKNILIKLGNESDDTLRIIILTHNIYYLYVQLSNIFENEELRNKTSFYRMTSTQVKHIEDLDILRTDDITLFKNCFDSLSSSDEVIILSGIVYKTFRQLIDFNHRFTGKKFNNDISNDIDELNLNKDQIEKLRKINSEINKISKKPQKLNYLEGVKLINLLFEASEVLGHENFIENLDKSKFNKNDKTILSEDLEGNGMVFDMVNAANDVLYRGHFDVMKGYLSHPRQQITKQITSISNDLS